MFTKRILGLTGVMLLLATGLAMAKDSGITHKTTLGQKAMVCGPWKDNRTHRESNVWLTITNWGFFGNHAPTNADAMTDPCRPGTWAPQCEYPAGSGVQYLYQGAIWIGALIVNDDGTETPRVSYGFEGWTGGNELFPGCDEADAIDERSYREGAYSCGQYVYDSLAVSEQDFWAVYTDTLTDPAYVQNDEVDNAHLPLGVKVTQVSHSWTYSYAQDFVIIDYEIENIGDKYLKNLYVGLYVDADVGVTDNENRHTDDICGFRIAALDSVTGNDVEINTAYIADNDGRNQNVHTGNDFVCPDVTGTRVLRAPNPKLSTMFNWWISNGNVDLDFGPSWEVYSDSSGWEWTRTLGTPAGDERKYQVMSNGEFDYDQIRVCQPEWIADHPQVITLSDGSTITREWLTPDASDPGDLCDGYDTRYLLSWGPLGIFDHVDPSGRLIYRLNPGEKFSMTVAYVGGQGFHDPSMPQGGGNPEFEKFNFRDLDFNAIWAMRVYDNEMHDTPIYDYGYDGVPGTNDLDGSEGDGILDTGDGWYGEDVGTDGLYAQAEGDSVYYFGQFMGIYEGPDADGTEMNGLLDDGEDDLLWSLEYILADSALIYAGPKYSKGGVGVKDWYIGHMGNNGFLDLGDGIPDFQGPPPPPCPNLSYSLTENAEGQLLDNVITLIWERNAQLESYRDPFSRLQDFEGYHVWVANTSLENEYTLIGEYDETDFAYYDSEGNLKSLPDPGPLDALPLISFEGFTRQRVLPQISPDSREPQVAGNNGGFGEIAYSYGDMGETILLDVNQDKWVGKGYLYRLDNSGSWALSELLTYGVPCNADGEPIGPDGSAWQPADGGLVIDDIQYEFLDENNEIVRVLGDRFVDSDGDRAWTPGADYRVEYRMTIDNARPLFPRYYSVTAYDFGDPVTGTGPLETSKSCNTTALAPAGNPQNDVKVVPNPYQAYVDYTEQYQFQNSETGLSWENQDDGTVDFYPQYDRRLEFVNLPRECLIRIYTVSGDLVQILPHNVDGDVNTRWSSDYSEGWDLNSRNEQQVTSGLYFFSVEDMTTEGEGDIQTGKFVIIR